MLYLAIEMFFMLVLIVAAAEIFTNALEHLGHRFGLSEGVTGSLFAAVGTALPEALIPVLAIFAGTDNKQVNEEIGVGAILGAPLMLATLACFIMAISVIRQRGITGFISPEPSGFRRDLNYFLIAYGLAALAMFVPHENIIARSGLSITLVGLYFIYILHTFKASRMLVDEGHGTEAERAMFLARTGLPMGLPLMVIQVLIGLALLIVGAHGFIQGVEGISEVIGVSALILSLLVIPVATELPEKVNSIIWVRRRRDTLAFGNLTGAMVFQGSLLPALGIMLTPWLPTSEVIPCLAITIMAAIWLRVNHFPNNGIRILSIMVCGLLYISYVGLALSGWEPQ